MGKIEAHKQSDCDCSKILILSQPTTTDVLMSESPNWIQGSIICLDLEIPFKYFFLLKPIGKLCHYSLSKRLSKSLS